MVLGRIYTSKTLKGLRIVTNWDDMEKVMLVYWYNNQLKTFREADYWRAVPHFKVSDFSMVLLRTMKNIC